MEKDSIFSVRKVLKKEGHRVLRSHYFVLAFLMLVMIFFGTEFALSSSAIGKIRETADEGPGTILSADQAVSSDDIYNLLLGGRLEEGEKRSEELEEDLMEQEPSSAAFGRTNGVLAWVVNAVGSGKLFVMLGKTVFSVTRSRQALTAFFISVSFLWYMMIFVFLKNLYSAVIRRIYLEARLYSGISPLEVTHFAAVGKWLRASVTMLVRYIFLSLWTLTIIGGLIKRYSYWAVPYIVAENPGVKGREAVTLSRRMMNGHKWELFKFEMTFIGWFLLEMVTFGASDIVYGSAYRLACYTEFYVRIREEALQKGLQGTEVLNDPYLYARADRILLAETYFDVVDELTVLHENKVELEGLRSKIEAWLGVWIGSIREKQAYDRYEGLLVFGIGCCAIIYLVAPLIDQMLSRVTPRILIGIAVVLAGFYFTDLVYSGKHPNMAKGAVEETAANEIPESFGEKLSGMKDLYGSGQGRSQAAG